MISQTISVLGNPQNTQTWLYDSVQSFFTTCNWEDQAARSDVQLLEQSVASESFTELSFELRVRQFFAAVNWEGTSIGSTPAIAPVETQPEANDGFTLTDFSDLF